MPSSFSSARLLFGEEPLNSFGEQRETDLDSYEIFKKEPETLIILDSR